MAIGASDCPELGRSIDYGRPNRRIFRDNPAGHGQSGLEHRDRRHIGPRQLVRKAIPIGIGIDAKTLGRLNAVVMIEGVVSELADGSHGTGLMIRKDDQAGSSRPAGFQAGRGQSYDLGCVPGAVGIVCDDAERHVFAYQRPAPTRRCGSGDRSQIGGHLPSYHLEKTGTIHADRLPVVRGVVYRDKLPRFIHSATRRNAVVVIERQMIKALRQNEDFRHAVAASTCDGYIVTTRT